MSEAKLKIQAALGDASVDMLSDMGSIPITFTSKTLEKPTVSAVGFFVRSILEISRQIQLCQNVFYRFSHDTFLASPSV